MSIWRAVLDAQVWVSGAISADGPARRDDPEATRACRTEDGPPYVRAEVREVLRRPSVRSLLAPGFEAQEWMESVEIVAADLVEHVSGPPIVTADPDDDPYLWTAWAGSATHVVTWDAEVLALKHFRNARIVDPGRFLDELRRRGASSAEGTAPAVASARRPRGKS